MSAAFIVLIFVFLQYGFARPCAFFPHFDHRDGIGVAYTNALQKAQIWLRCG
jgi:hypothetical protein